MRWISRVLALAVIALGVVLTIFTVLAGHSRCRCHLGAPHYRRGQRTE